ncbi:flavin-containing monooxygenase [Phreatobacter stygius]|uniref:Trimethylamine monooxygenase n=1 Tax=Phreatobacter stygius TaxID=1940610 RepID=A0A4D7AVG8_9HYPH|nr:NAD(P)-binding domain-containing protein [Phreatobacter stygius]QCI63751.1 monooxygenase [Phreatobacter stygius]
MTFLVIGAGPAGLATARVFKAAGLPFEVVERHADIGGQWLYGAPSSGVYASTHLISSKTTTAFADYPMPEDWPAYPHHAQVLDYLKNFTRHFGLYPSIRFNRAVTRLTRQEDGWRASFDDGTSLDYQGVVIANGHLTDPELPQIPGSFSGELMHSKTYKNAAIFSGKRVLIVGMGNTGCDIAVDAVHRASKVLWSVRSGNHFAPKFLRGKPADEANHKAKLVLPRRLRSILHEAVLRFVVGSPEDFGLPRPAHRLYDRTPVVNSLVLQHLGQGDIAVRPPIEELDGNRVIFTDGQTDEVDLVLLATGYRITFPFLDEAGLIRELNWKAPAPHLHLNIFPPTDNNLFVVGMIEGAGIGWPGRDLQAKIVAAYLAARKDAPDKAQSFRREIKRHCAAPRPRDAGPHGIFIDFVDYKRVLGKGIERLS